MEADSSKSRWGGGCISISPGDEEKEEEGNISKETNNGGREIVSSGEKTLSLPGKDRDLNWGFHARGDHPRSEKGSLDCNFGETQLGFRRRVTFSSSGERSGEPLAGRIVRFAGSRNEVGLRVLANLVLEREKEEGGPSARREKSRRGYTEFLQESSLRNGLGGAEVFWRYLS